MRLHHPEPGMGRAASSSMFTRDFDLRPSTTLSRQSAPRLDQLPGRSRQQGSFDHFQTQYTRSYNAEQPQYKAENLLARPHTSWPSTRHAYQDQALAANLPQGAYSAHALAPTYSVARHRSLGRRTSSFHPDIKLGWRPRNVEPQPSMRHDTFLPPPARKVNTGVM